MTAELEEQAEDQEVRSIYRTLTEAEQTVTTTGAVTASRNESQSADLFQELQREVATEDRNSSSLASLMSSVSAVQ